MRCRIVYFVFSICLVAANVTAADMTSDTAHRVARRLRDAYGESDSLAKKKASRRHDRVTIVVNRKTNAKMEATTDLQRESSISTAVSNWFTLKLDKEGNLLANPRNGTNKPTINATATREHLGEGETNRLQTISNMISGEVIDVKPNGQMVVTARTQIRVNEEVETVTLTGRVDPKDLSPDSKVDANYIIDLQYKVSGKGEITQSIRRGWAARVLDVINPF